MEMIETKSIPVTREMVKVAFEKVKANGGGAGIDEQSIKDFQVKLEDNLYKLWNRLASGSYFPPAVKEVEIPKKDGKLRKLGIPTVADRVAQTVVKEYIEPRFEALFSDSSYGYRPGRNCHQALTQVRDNCWKIDWVIDLDIKGFFDNIDHGLLMLAVDKHVEEKWVKMYINRWLQMPIQTREGELQRRAGKGTPQGGVISPLLANVFLHYGFDKWMLMHYPDIRFTRYADDIIVHCQSLAKSEEVLAAIANRLKQCRLELHPEKTKIIYCRDEHRKEQYANKKFTFLGYSFQPREAKSKRGIFVAFGPAISKESRKKIVASLRATNLQRATNATIEEIAKVLSPRIQGWLNYFTKFRKSEMRGVFYYLNERLAHWAKNRYKSLNWHQAYRWIRRQIRINPALFPHWKAGFVGV
jgi:group II intron reverse transcriptase/maturase